jgi:hypothetical protein
MLRHTVAIRQSFGLCLYARHTNSTVPISKAESKYIPYGRCHTGWLHKHTAETIHRSLLDDLSLGLVSPHGLCCATGVASVTGVVCATDCSSATLPYDEVRTDEDTCEGVASAVLDS